MAGMPGGTEDGAGAIGGAQHRPGVLPAGCGTGLRHYVIVVFGLGFTAAVCGLIEHVRGGDPATAVGFGLLLGMFVLWIIEKLRLISTGVSGIARESHGKGAFVGLVLGVVWITGQAEVDPRRMDLGSGAGVAMTLIFAALFSGMGGLIGRACALRMWKGLAVGVAFVPVVFMNGKPPAGNMAIALQLLWLSSILPTLGFLAEVWWLARRSRAEEGGAAPPDSGLHG